MTETQLDPHYWSTDLRGFSSRLKLNGFILPMTLPLIKASGIGPNILESRDAGRLSPTIQQWP